MTQLERLLIFLIDAPPFISFRKKGKVNKKKCYTAFTTGWVCYSLCSAAALTISLCQSLFAVYGEISRLLPHHLRYCSEMEKIETRVTTHNV